MATTAKTHEHHSLTIDLSKIWPFMQQWAKHAIQNKFLQSQIYIQFPLQGALALDILLNWITKT